jgi:dihydrofolate reductase
MAKFLYSAAMSLDGFIAGPGGDMSWMTDYLGPNSVVDELITETGAILAGNRTFGGDDPYKGQAGEGEAFGGGWQGPQFVLTHRPPADPVPGVTFVGDIETAVDESGSAAGDKYVNVLGASVAAECLEGGVRAAGAARRRHQAVRAPRRQDRATRTDKRHSHATGDQSLVSRRQRVARASACTPVTICDSVRLAYPSINPGGAASGSA